jgi:hypothetical protein
LCCYNKSIKENGKILESAAGSDTDIDKKRGISP